MAATATPPPYADLELHLLPPQAFSQRPQPGAIPCPVTLRFTLPGSDVASDLLGSRQPTATFDFAALRTFALDPAAYGQALGQMLFADPNLLSAWREARAIAHVRGHGLRLRLRLPLGTAALHALLWETLWVPGESSPLAQSDHLLFSRYLESRDRTPVTPRLAGGLTAFVVAPNPHDLAQRSLAPGDAAGEIARARAALEPAITVQTLDPGEHATLAALERHLHAGPAILYLVCHGQLVDGRPYLVLEDEWGAAQRIRGEDLAARLEQLRSRPQLVVLAACESAGPAALAPAADPASANALSAAGPLLVAAGIPAVVAMQGSVTMATVAHCMPVFFAELAQHGVIDLALAAARRCVAGRPDWWAPVLYLRLLSGRLFAARDPVAAAPFRVPFLRNPSFVGREQDLADLHAALSSAATVGIRSALSTAAASAAGLTGMGGIGKTQLAVEYCYRYREAYPGGIFWLNAAADWRGEFADLGAYLEPDLASEPDVRCIRAAAGYLNTHADSLLMLDNVTDPGQLREPVTPDLIPANLHCRILLTTRLRNLGDVRPVEVTVLPESPALQLLLSDPTRQPALDTAHREHAAAQRICAVLGRLPLALEIAGTFLGRRSQLPLAAYCDELLARGALRIIDDPRTGVREVDLGTRHAAAMAATLSSQWESLENDDARLLLRVAGQLSEAAAIPVARLGLLAGVPAKEDIVFGSPLDRALDELGRLSLIEGLAGDELRLHPLVREFAQTQTRNADTPAFRHTCALNLLGAYRDIAELERQCAKRGVDALEVDLNTAVHLLPDTEVVRPHRAMLQQLLRMLQHESHILRRWNPALQPALLLQQWRKRTLINGEAQQAQAAVSALAGLSVPHVDLLWTTTRESAGLERTLSGHAGSVRTVMVTADGQRAVSASSDRTLKVWSLASGAALHTLSGHTDVVRAVAVTADGRQAVSASSDRTLKVWELASGAALHTLSGHVGAVRAVAVTADGRQAVSASDDHTLKVWELASGAELHTLSGHAGTVNVVAVTVDGRQAVSASSDRTLKVWDLASGAELHTLSGHTDSVVAVAVTADGRQAVSASDDGTLKVWDLASGAALHTLSGHTNWVWAVAVTADGRRAVSASDDHTLKVWDLASGAALHTLSGHTDWVVAVAVTADGQRAVSASRDRTLKVWDLASGAARPTLSGHAGSVRAVAVTADGRQAVSASSDHTLKVWDLASGAALHTLSGYTGSVQILAVTADGQRVVSASMDHTLRVWDLASGARLHMLGGHTRPVNVVAVTADGRQAVSASDDRTLKVWELASGAELHTLSGHTDSVVAVAVTVDGRQAVSASSDRTLKVWDLASGAELHTLSGHTDSVVAVAVTADGRQAVSASDDGTLKVWDLASGAALHTLSGHTDSVVAVTVTTDGERVVSASDDHTLKVWDLASGAELHTLSGHMDSVVAVAVATDGERAVSASDDGTLQVWDLAARSSPVGITLDAALSCVQYAPDDLTIIAGDADGNVHCLRYADPRLPAARGEP